MKQFVFFFYLMFLTVLVFAQKTNMNADQIRQEIARVRHETNYNDPVKANEANEKIKELSKQLIILGQTTNQRGNVPEKAKSEDEADFRTQLLDEMTRVVASDQNSAMDLALGLRKEIVEDYKEDESPKNIPPEFLQEMTLLVIDMSLPTIQRTIDGMHNYNSISTLVITGGKNGAIVNLPDLLIRAAKFPLKNLYIINFGQFLTTIPDQINQFKNLSTLAVFNNKISQLPNMSGFSSQLDSLFVDANPVATLFPVVSSMSKLKTLGIIKTSVSPAEISKIEALLPKCKILTK
ncbi:MAG: hypothetical protein WCI54_04730 [Bacteroidia bacterium]